MAPATPAKPTRKQQRLQQKQLPAKKTCLASPFSAPCWSALPHSDMLFILSALKDRLQAVGLEKTETNPFRQWRKKKPSEKDPVMSPPAVIEPSSGSSGPPSSGPSGPPSSGSSGPSGPPSSGSSGPSGPPSSGPSGPPSSGSSGPPSSGSSGPPSSGSSGPPSSGPSGPPSSGSSGPPSSGPSGPAAGWTVLAARRQLALGINEVTRALERNQLSLVLVCKSVKPAHMSNHLIALSRTREVPACQVPQLSSTVSAPLGLRSVLALGFHRHGDVFADTVDAIVPRVPALHVDWMDAGTAATPREEEEGEEGGGARKRKFDQLKDDDDAEDDDDEDDSSKMEAESEEKKVEDGDDATRKAALCRLLPLNVKKIVPNPLKKRKPKRNKKKSKA